MTTATRRLRRASIAGLATIATAGVTVLASGGSAFALANSSATLASGGVATLSAGTSNQALSDVTVKFQDTSGASVFSAGEQIKFELTDGSGNELTDTTSNTLNYVAFAGTPTVTADNGATASVSVSSGATSNQNDDLTLTFTKDAAQDTNTTTFTISGLKVNVGSKFNAGQDVFLEAIDTVPGGATPFGANTAVQVGTLPQVSVTTSKVAVSTGGATNVALGTISIKDVVGGSIKDTDTVSVVLDNGAAFTTAPTASGTPGAANITIATTNTANDTITFTVNAASAANNTITLTGAKITNAAAGKAVTATVDTTAGLGLPGSAKVAVAVDQSRLGGADRYGTASIVFNDGGFNSNSVVLTSGANFPDALSAQYLASALTAGGNPVGVLTTDPNALPSQTRTQLVSGNIDTVYIVGGTAAVSANVAAQVAALHVGNVPTNANLNVIRIAGADRYATNNATDLYLGAIGGSGHAYLATGENFADALAIGPAVYSSGDPLILTTGGTLTDAAKSTIQSLGITDVTIVGGTAAVSTAVETALTNLNVTIDERLAGADRTQTAAAIANWEVANLGGFNITNVYIARGDNFADALVAGPDAGLNTQPILLTGDPNTLGAGIPSVLGSSTTTTSLTALGLTSAVSVATLNAAAASIG